jgi:iron complex outermembrane recepter protein
MRNIFIIIFILQSLNVLGHDKLVLSGHIHDEHGLPMVGVHVFLADNVTASGLDGEFVFHDLEPGEYTLKCNFIGYRSYQSIVVLQNNTALIINMTPDILSLGEVVITDKKNGDLQTLKSDIIHSQAIMDRYAGSFIKSIESMPGVNAMDIGASMSKPVIRGLGFNRVVVTENGIKQEGQQWGADHGLEIDPFSVEKAEIIKGASSIEYGSDAIGGVINIENSRIPEKHSLSGEVSLLAKSVNQTIGGSLFTQYRGDRYYFKLRGTVLDYGDYNIPTDRINYLNTIMPIYDNRLKNTAGNEKDFYAVAGYLSNNFRSSLSVSNVDQLQGFFPGAHGIPSIERVQQDGNRRNLDLPYQHSTHLKAINNSVLILGNHDLHLDLGYQVNHRQEWSRFHTHFSGQSPPEVDPDLELDFKLRTYSINAKYHFHISRHNLTIGSQNQFQDNEIGGYNYFLPAFNRRTYGLFIKDNIEINDRLKLTLGLRHDWGRTQIKGFYDSLLHRDLQIRGFGDQADFYANRGIASQNSDINMSWLAGMVYQIDPKWATRFNLGKSYRLPLAIELGANGIHHGSFRHELGNPSLDSERGYYIDGAIEYESKALGLSLNPYAYYFSNYIFLNPTSTWSFLAHAGQIYEYTQSRALLSGIEMTFSKSFGRRLVFSGNMEYILNQQLSGESRHYSMPLTPPFNGFGELEYGFGALSDNSSNFSVFLNSRFALRQSQLAKNEKSTPGYQVFGVGVKKSISIGGNMIDLSLQAQNVFNTRYFNHISFYRKLEIPEPGRNIQLLVKVPFNK